MQFGAHESVAGGWHLALERGIADECRAIQIFTKNSSAWREPEIDSARIAQFRASHEKAGRFPVMAHTSYLINLAADKVDILERSVAALVAEVQRSSQLGIAYCVLHPGAHLGLGEDRALQRVAECLDEVHARTEGATSRIAIENTAGQGSTLGHRFEQIAALFESVHAPDRMAVCFDTQHAFAAGYDLSTADGYARTFEDFDRIVGLSRLGGFHINDSKKPLGSRVDRHEHIGEGILGMGCFWRLANDIRFVDLPAVVETEPREGAEPYKAEVALLRSLVGAPEPKVQAPVFRLEVVEPPKKGASRKR